MYRVAPATGEAGWTLTQGMLTTCVAQARSGCPPTRSFGRPAAFRLFTPPKDDPTFQTPLGKRIPHSSPPRHLITVAMLEEKNDSGGVELKGFDEQQKHEDASAVARLVWKQSLSALLTRQR